MRLLLCLLISLIFASCANQVTPTGGKKDTTPPVVLDYEPDSATVFFDAKQITLVFNEYVQLNDVFNQVIVSPPLDATPEIKLKGKTVTINLNSELKPSTTYTINFGQAIKDITEGNALENFTYVFSTGAFIDSLKVSGKVTDLLTAAPATKAYVVLYYEPTDTSFTKTKPYYFAKTDNAGNFTINNIKAGNYNLYAIEDQNYNYYYDLPNEKIAFQTSTIQIDSNISNQKLQLFSEDKTLQNLQEIKSTRYGQTRLIFSKNTSSTKITYSGTDTSSIYFSRNKTNDTILFWKTNYLLDTHQLTISFDTSVINRMVEIKSFPKDSNFYKQTNTFTSNVSNISKGADANARADWDPGRTVQLNFYNPIKSLTPNAIQVYKDSVALTTATITIDSLDARKIYIQYDWLPGTPYNIILADKSTKDIFGLTNIGDTLKIQTRKADAYATLSTTIKNNSNNNLIFQLMKFDLTIIDERYLTKSLFENPDKTFLVKQLNLLPGVYKIRVIIDADGNGKWTPGNLATKQLPETVLFFPVDQNLRANWENEIDWEIF